VYLYRKIVTFQDVQYIVKKNYAILQESLIRFAKTELRKLINEERIEDLDNTPCTRISEDMDIGKFIEKIHERLKMACSKTFRIRVPKKATAQAISLVDRVTDN